MNRVAAISITLPLSDGVLATASDLTELALDCSDCRRRRRTVLFRRGESHGTCTPTGHPFRGVLLEMRQRMEGGRFIAEYEVEYQYEPFVDAKYPDGLPYYGPSEGVPSWARINFTLTCPRCRSVAPRSTQSNLVRPYTETCGCGYALYTDEAPPAVTWRDEGAT